MIFSDALEIAIGVAFVFFLVSLIMTSVVELIESATKTRSAKLYEAVVELLGDPAKEQTGRAAATALYSHPLVQGLFTGTPAGARASKQLPSYIPARNFALALIGQVLDGRVNAAASNASLPAAGSFGDRLQLASERIDNDQLRRAIAQAVAIGGDDAEAVRRHLQQWYDSAMDRVAGAYKRRSMRLSFVLGLALALLLNVNAWTLADSLSKNATLRRAVVAEVEAAKVSETATGQEAQAAIQKIGLPIGWSGEAVEDLTRPVTTAPNDLALLLALIQIGLGWLMTAFAVTLGAPFWFDVLNRLMVIRATVKPHEKSPEEGSEDRPGKEPDAVSDKSAAPQPPAATVFDDDVYGELPTAAERLFEDSFE